MKKKIICALLLLAPFGMQAQHNPADSYVDRTGWSWTPSTTCNKGAEGSADGHIDAAFDGNNNTFWHTNYFGDDGILPHYVLLDLGESRTFEGIALTPRPGNNNGRSTAWRVYVSDNAFDLTQGASAEVLGAPTLKGNFIYENTSDNAEKCAVFNEPQTGRYVLIVSDASVSGTHFTITELNLLQTAGATARDLLAEAITRADELIANQSGTQFGDYDPAILRPALEAAKAVNDEADFTTTATTLNRLNDAIQAAFVTPDPARQYFLVSVSQKFLSVQGKEVSLQSVSNDKFVWATLDESATSNLWEFVPVGEHYAITGGMKLRNVGNGRYMASPGVLSDEGASVSLSLRETGQYYINVNGVLHCGGHGNGANESGDVISYPNEDMSAWYIRDASFEQIATPLKTEMSRLIETYKERNADVPGELGWCGKPAYDALEAAYEQLCEKTNSQTLKQAEEAVAALRATIIHPVFLIKNRQPDYGVGNAIIDDTNGGACHFGKADGVDGRMLWVVSMTSAEATTGEYEMYNLYTGRPLMGRLNVTVTETDENDPADGCFIIRQGNDVVHAQNKDHVIVYWNETTANSGSSWTFEYVGHTAEMPANYLFDAYREAKELQQKVAGLKELIGQGLGHYTLNGQTEGVRERIETAEARLQAITLTNIVDALELGYEMTALTEGLSINRPQTMRFYSMQSETGRYVSATGAGERLALTDRADEGIFFYNVMKQPVFFNGGHGITGGAFTAPAGGDMNAVDFAGSAIVPGHYTAATDHFTAPYMSAGTTDVKSETGNNSPDCGWILQEVTTLPVDIAAGYTTLFVPVALRVPTGVKVYTGHLANGRLHLLEITEEVIPAATAVILKAETSGTYHFELADDHTAAIGNDLMGFDTAVPANSSVWTLQCVDGVWGMFPTGKADVLPGFKAYIAAGESTGYVLDESPISGIEHIDATPNATDAIYDLSGRRITTPTKGIHIRNGRKFIIK